MIIHNARKHTIIACGISFQKGWSDGVVATVEPVGEGYTDHSGTDGEVTRADTGENRFTVTLNTMQGADVNALLMALYTAGKVTGNGSDVAPFLIRNQLGTFEFASAESWIVSPAVWSLDRAPATRPWIFRVVAPAIVGA